MGEWNQYRDSGGVQASSCGWSGSFRRPGDRYRRRWTTRDKSYTPSPKLAELVPKAVMSGKIKWLIVLDLPWFEQMPDLADPMILWYAKPANRTLSRYETTLNLLQTCVSPFFLLHPGSGPANTVSWMGNAFPVDDATAFVHNLRSLVLFFFGIYM